MNIDNNNNNTGHYPLYLGEELGMLDSIHECYPDISECHAMLLRQRWHWLEIDMTQDRVDLDNPALKQGRDALVRNLGYQYVSDGLATGSIVEIMSPICSNTELLGLLQEWSCNEFVHSLAYSEIIKKGFDDPNELLESIKDTPIIRERLKPIQDIFDITREMTYSRKLGKPIARDETVIEQVILYHSALLALEGIGFSGSFAATFGTCKAFKAFSGICSTVQLIARDELDAHVKCGKVVLQSLRKSHPIQFKRMLPHIQVLYDTVYRLEIEWMDYLFEDINIVGFNRTSLTKYIQFLSKPLYDFLGITYTHGVVETNPLPWMNDYLDLNSIQVAPQEKEVVNYNVGVLDDDVGDGFDF